MCGVGGALAAGGAHGSDGAVAIGDGGIEGGLGLGVGVLGGGQFFLRDRAGRGQVLAACQFGLGVVEARLRRGDLGAGAFDVGLAGAQLPFKRLVAGVVALDVALGERKRGLGLGDIDAGVGVIDGQEDIAGLDGLGFADQHLGDRTGDEGVDLSGIGADIGVVGRDVMRSDEAVIGAPGDHADGDCGADIGQQALALGVAGGLGIGGRCARGVNRGDIGVFGGIFRGDGGSGGIGHDVISVRAVSSKMGN